MNVTETLSHETGFRMCDTMSSGVSLQSGDAVEVCRSDPETDDGLQGGTDPRSVALGHCRPPRV